jgi:hypothetical protein
MSPNPLKKEIPSNLEANEGHRREESIQTGEARVKKTIKKRQYAHIHAKVIPSCCDILPTFKTCNWNIACLPEPGRNGTIGRQSLGV